ncbi:MAG TPA: hypothetical protein PKN62_02895 [bacterium]|nr:hypothetical protein [bacterium]
MLNSRKTIIRFGLPIILVLLIAVLVVPFTFGRVKPYYQGDAVNYRGRLLIASTNMDRLQLFETADQKISVLAELAPDKTGYLSGDNFYNCAFHEENNQLFLYAVNGRYMYKYDVSNPNQPELINKLKDNSWDWFRSVNVFNDHIVTLGTKGIKVWNNNLEVVDSYDIKLENPNNFIMGPQFLVAVEAEQLKIYDLKSRQWTANANLTIKENSNRQIYNDALTSSVYVADDWAVKQFDLAGNLLKSFRFTANTGYAVVPASNGQDIYTSDGVGVVKLAKNDLTASKWAYASESGVKDSWSMGLKAVNWQGSEHLVIFNNGAISVLNGQMKKVANFLSTEERGTVPPDTTEPLMLALDKNRTSVGSQISLRGAGFAANENLEIQFLSNKAATSSVTADSLGRFQQTITVPEITGQNEYTANPLPTDIKVTGKTSGRHYSINFFIEN